jgi:hypothetical protein
MRPRLVALANLAGDILGAVRSGAEHLLRGGSPPAANEQDSAAEVKRRLDATHERLKREIPPGEEPPGETPPD